MRLWPHRVHPRYIVMELCTGGDLCGRLRQPNNRHGVGEKGIATMMEEMLAAVYYLHDHGVVHRDIKLDSECLPSNLVGAVGLGLGRGISISAFRRPSVDQTSCSRTRAKDPSSS